MAKITYLLGAGASANCLPTYSNFKRRFDLFIREFSIQKNITYENVQKEIISIGNKLIDELDFHNTPDTIAKKYFHQGRIDNINDLKKVITLFFIYEQTQKNYFELEGSTPIQVKSQFDKRYDSFLASILQPLKGKLQIFDQFKILTWNYDIQFEIAFSNYSNKKFAEIQETIQSVPLINGEDTKQIDTRKFTIIHLNGIAAISNKTENLLVNNFFYKNSYPFEDLIKYYIDMTTDKKEIINSNFSFAWENYESGNLAKNKSVLKDATLIALEAEILVIIGYSFPIFNRDIDKMLLSEMKNLEKVYVQTDQYDKIGNILQNDLLLSKGFRMGRNILNVGYVDQFFIPPEWDYKKNKVPASSYFQ